MGWLASGAQRKLEDSPPGKGLQAMARTLTVDLIAGRDCGSCTVCCKSPAIDSPELQKTTGVLCRHCVEGAGCQIYQSRPQVCRDWFCGWRVLGHLADDWRPDKSDVLIDFLTEDLVAADDVPARYDRTVMIELMILRPDAIAWEHIVEVIGGFVAADVPTFLALPGPVGYHSARFFLNEAIKDAVAMRDGDSVMTTLDGAMKLLSCHQFVPVELGRRQ